MNIFEYQDIVVNGLSTGGVENCYALPKWQVGFDLGRCPSFMIEQSNIFLSHGHLDHAAGIPFYFSQRSLQNLPTGNIYVPQEIEEPLHQIVKRWQQIEKFEYPIQIHGIKPSQEIWLNKDFFVRALPAFHRISALGYILYQRKKKLKKEFLHLSQTEIVALKKQGTELTNIVDIPLFAYSGDSSIEFVLENPEVQHAKVLFLECTYIDDDRPVQRARDWGHIHLYEIIEHAKLFQNERLVLMHFSRRYYPKQIKKQLQKKVPDFLYPRVDFFYVDKPF